MRKTIGGILAAIIVAGGLLPVWGQSKPLYSDVPQTHWAYDALQSLLQMGFTSGIPDGTYSGRRAITRAEFAHCTARIAYQGSIRAGIGWPGRPLALRRKIAGRYILDLLASEFTPELATLKLDGEAFQHRMERMRALCRDGRPQGVEAPMAPPVSYLNEDSRVAAIRAPRAEDRCRASGCGTGQHRRPTDLGGG